MAKAQPAISTANASKAYAPIGFPGDEMVAEETAAMAPTKGEEIVLADDDKPADEVVEEPVVEEPTEVEEPAPATTAVSSDLIDEAARYGIDKAQAEALGDNLEMFLAKMDAQAAQLMRQELQDGDGDEPEREPVREREPEQRPTQLSAIPKFELKLERDNYDDGTLKAYDSIEQQINNAIEAINKQQELMSALGQLTVSNHNGLQQISQRAASDSSSTIAREADTFFAGLGDDFKDIYGKAPLAHYRDKDSQVGSRNDLLEQAWMIRAAHERQGRPVGTTTDYLRAALRVLHPDKIVKQAKAEAREEVTKEIKDRRKAAIARPSGRALKAGSPDKRALSAIETALAGMGLKNY